MLTVWTVMDSWLAQTKHLSSVMLDISSSIALSLVTVTVLVHFE